MDNNDIKKLSFEQAVSALEAIISQMERGNLPLEESISQYEIGERLKKHAEKKLQQAKLRLNKLLNVTEEGNINKESIN